MCHVDGMHTVYAQAVYSEQLVHCICRADTVSAHAHTHATFPSSRLPGTVTTVMSTSQRLALIDLLPYHSIVQGMQLYAHGALHCFCRPEGKRMVPRPESECSALFREAPPAAQQQQQQQQQQPPGPSSSARVPAAAAKGTVDRVSIRNQHTTGSASTEQPSITTATAVCQCVHSHSDSIHTAAMAAGAGVGSAAASSGQLACAAGQQHNSSSSSHACTRQLDPRYIEQLQAVQALQPAGDLGKGRTGVAPRVQDNPDYFRT
jgi:hypothetical protein